MKACVLNSPAPIDTRPLQLTEVAVPTPGDEEVLIRVSVCGICRTDLHVVEGDLPVRTPRVIPGHQVIGEIVDVGAEVTKLSAGQRIGVAWLRHTCGECRYC